MARWPMLAVTLAGTAVPAVSSAQWTFQSEGTYLPCAERFTWDFEDMDGSIADGTCDAFDGCMALYVDDQPFPATTYSSAHDGHGFSTDTEPVSGVNITRWILVPQAGRPFARFLDLFENPSGDPLDVTVRYRCNLGSDGEETGYGADGDSRPEASDTWIASDDADAAGDPSLAFVVQGPGAAVGLERWVSAPGTGSVDFEYGLPLGPAETKALVVFVVQESDRAASYDTATWLESLPAEALAFLEGELEIVQNFVAPGIPSVSLGGPYAVAEGSTIELQATTYDADGDSVSVSWDLNDDGVYETVGETATFDASRLDGGPALAPLPIGIRATDGESEVFRRGVVEVVNVPPALGGLPDPEAVVGAPWVAPLRPRVVEPCSADEVTLELVDSPAGVLLDEEGALVWTPSAADVGDHVISVRLTDDDDGERLQEIGVAVRTNDPPTPARPVAPEPGEVVGLTRPLFVIGNATDPDGDPVTYEIEIHSAGEGDCDGAEEVVSQRIDGHPSGNTSWTPAERLCRGTAYTWDLRACDPYACNEAVLQDFAVDPHAVDETIPGSGDPAGCACRTTRPAGRGAFAVFAIGLLAVRRSMGKVRTPTHGRAHE